MNTSRRAARLLAVLATPLAVSAGTADVAAAHDGRGGTLYTISNDPAGNAVIALDRAADGTLTPAGVFPTGGTGSGAGLGSQRAVVLSDDGRTLLAVNPGSDEVSAFAVERDGALRLLGTVPSGGDLPTSATVHRNVVYVLNAGDATISGFRLERSGLSPLTGSTRTLSAPASAPAQVEFTPRGDRLVVTQRATDTIDVFDVGRDGLAGDAQPQTSAGVTPFGFAFDRRGRLVVTNAAGGAPDASSVTSYELGRDGTLAVLEAEVATTETAACWVEITRDGRFAFVTNTGSGTVSAFAIGRDGDLTLLDDDGVAATTGAGPIDAAITGDGRFFYTVNAGADSISAFAIGRDGSLTPVGETAGLPVAVVGLAAT